tara:strand:- start:2159 stop:3943 length:1785 start_codon:yes stop_codon:yes gene_type:complete
MPKKGTTTKYKRRAGVNIGSLKKEGFAFDPPIPTDQFGGDVKALRQFKVEYKPDGTGRAKQWKGIHKNLETGKLYLADGERYRELTDTEYEYITKEIGESKQLGDVEKRIGKPFRERAKEEEVIEPVEFKVEPAKQQKKRGRPKQTQPKNSVSDYAIAESIAYMELTNMMPHEQTEELEVSEVKVRGIILYEDDDGRLYEPAEETHWVATRSMFRYFANQEPKELLHIRDSEFFENRFYNSDPDSDDEIGSIIDEVLEGTEKKSLTGGGAAAAATAEEDAGSTEEEDDDQSRPMTIEDVGEDDDIIKMGKQIALRFIPQIDVSPPDSNPIFTEYPDGKPVLGNEEAGEYYPTAADEDWVYRQQGTEEEKALYYTNKDDDIIYREDEETGEEDEIVGIRAMRGHRRVLIFSPEQVGLDYPLLYDWEDKDSLGNAYEYEIPEDDLGMLVESRYEEGFDFYEDSKQQAMDAVRTRNKSIEELKQDLRYMNVEPYRAFHLSVLKEKTEMREQVINEIAEEILGSEIEESLKSKILEDLKSSISKKETTDMGGGKGIVQQPKKMKIKKKKMSEAQLAALAAARERRLAKIAADKAANKK